MGLQLGTYLTQGSNHLTLLAFPRDPGSGSGSGSGAVGTANASLRIADEAFGRCIGCVPGTPFAIVTNMSVSTRHRGRGLGRQLLQLALEQAQRQFRPAADLQVLMVYQDNDAAVTLYRWVGWGLGCCWGGGAEGAGGWGAERTRVHSGGQPVRAAG
jgi:GNAT superfamily N-acetyltransferase